MITRMNLCFLLKRSEILLGEVQRGAFKGYLTGTEGKLDEREDLRYQSLLADGEKELAERVMRESVIREVREETGLTIDSYEAIDKLGVVHFDFTFKPGTLEVHWYRSNHFRGELRDSAEMHNRWFHVAGIPLHRMMPIDKELVPCVLNGTTFFGDCTYRKEGKLFAMERRHIKYASMHEPKRGYR
jgi:8-oxo-dGTP pyrophosphatase MutT (NUDIX family)